MNPTKLIKITLSLNHSLRDDALNLLEKLKTPHVLLQSARNSTILPSKLLQSRKNLKDEQQTAIEFYIPYELELFYLQTLVDGLSLLIPGRGSIFSQAIMLYSPVYQHKDIEISDLKRHVIEQILSNNMHVISLICPRGEANEFCRSLLNNGYPSPLIYYGTGMGTRSRMGLLRITIPPEKEILLLPVHAKDSSFVLQNLAQQARIDLPGKGYLSYFPLRYAKINTKTHNSDPSRLASIEQIISAIDTLQGGVEWRRKNIHSSTSQSWPTEKKLLQLTFIGQRGISEILTPVAFELGARGATMTRKSFYCFENCQEEEDTREREACTISLSLEIASKLILHITDHYDWHNIGLTAIEEYEIFHMS